MKGRCAVNSCAKTAIKVPKTTFQPQVPLYRGIAMMDVALLISKISLPWQNCSNRDSPALDEAAIRVCHGQYQSACSR